MTKRDEAVYIISVAAELSGMHPQTLRIYERRGLIEPYRTPGGTRRYSAEDLAQLGLIQELTSEGVNLEGVKRIMELQDENVQTARPGGPAASSARRVRGTGQRYRSRDARSSTPSRYAGGATFPTFGVPVPSAENPLHRPAARRTALPVGDECS